MSGHESRRKGGHLLGGGGPCTWAVKMGQTVPRFPVSPRPLPALARKAAAWPWCAETRLRHPRGPGGFSGCLCREDVAVSLQSCSPGSSGCLSLHGEQPAVWRKPRLHQPLQPGAAHPSQENPPSEASSGQNLQDVCKLLHTYVYNFMWLSYYENCLFFFFLLIQLKLVF